MTTYFAPHSVKLLATGSALPKYRFNNDTLLSALLTHTDLQTVKKAKRLIKKMGVTERYLSRPLEKAIEPALHSTPELCHKAVANTLERVKSPIEIGYLIGHTASPHTLIPPNIAWVTEKLQYKGPFMELRQACTGFANALQIASPMLYANPKLSSIMIVGSEVGSVYFDCAKDPYDISQLINYVQMGDGAATALIAANDDSQAQIISDIFLGHIGLDKDSGFYLEGGSRKPNCSDNHTTQPFHHKTNQVFNHGAELFLKGLDAIYQRGYQLEHFNYIIPHQANGYMAKYISHALDIPEEKIILHANKVGNMGSAAIWYSLDQLLKSNRLSQGDKVLVLGAEATKYLYGGFVYQH